MELFKNNKDILKGFTNLEIAALLYKSDTRNLSNELLALYKDPNTIDPKLSDKNIKDMFLTPIDDNKVEVLKNRAFKEREQALLLKTKLLKIADMKEVDEPLSVFSRYRHFIH